MSEVPIAPIAIVTFCHLGENVHFTIVLKLNT